MSPNLVKCRVPGQLALAGVGERSGKGSNMAANILFHSFFISLGSQWVEGEGNSPIRHGKSI